MTHGGYGGGQPDPFGSDPFGGPPSTQGYMPPLTPGSPPVTGRVFPPSGRPSGEVNKFATLSIVFAFVFAPVGAVLGHVALSQIKRSGQRGRERAIVGLTISYVIIVLAVIALVIWLLIANASESPSSPGRDDGDAEDDTTRFAATSAHHGLHATPGPAADGHRGAAAGRRLRRGPADAAGPDQRARNERHPHISGALRGPRRCIPGRPDLVDQCMPWADTVQQARNGICMHLGFPRLMMMRLCSLTGLSRECTADACSRVAGLQLGVGPGRR